MICLVGNKLDLEDKRQVSYEEGKNFADENDLLFFETSARDGNNIKEKDTIIDHVLGQEVIHLKNNIIKKI